MGFRIVLECTHGLHGGGALAASVARREPSTELAVERDDVAVLVLGQKMCRHHHSRPEELVVGSVWSGCVRSSWLAFRWCFLRGTEMSLLGVPLLGSFGAIDSTMRRTDSTRRGVLRFSCVIGDCTFIDLAQSADLAPTTDLAPRCFNPCVHKQHEACTAERTRTRGVVNSIEVWCLEFRCAACHSSAFIQIWRRMVSTMRRTGSKKRARRSERARAAW